MYPCPPWGFCATPVTVEQFVDGRCGSRNGIHGYDGYVTNKGLKRDLRAQGLDDLADRLDQLQVDPNPSKSLDETPEEGR
jgi:hypothetical protein